MLDGARLTIANINKPAVITRTFTLGDNSFCIFVPPIRSTGTKIQKLSHTQSLNDLKKPAHFFASEPI